MKRKTIIRAGLIIGLLLTLVFFVPIVIANANSRPLYGDFDMGVQCMGGHEIFLHLDEDEAFDNCPGHRDMTAVGRVERSGNSVTIHRPKDDIPWCRVNLEGSNHTFTFLSSNSTHDIPQVNNPWRTWFPKFLPEE